MNQTGADKKAGKWFLQSVEDYARPKLVALVPSFVETYHLTVMTVLWSAGVVLAGWLARENINWLWFSSLMLVCQYLTDLLDGAVGRARSTGLIKWGFYMDHFLDYIFFTALILSYSFVFPVEEVYWLMAIGLLQIGFMINMFLAFAVTQEFKISVAGFGPTEIRILYIIFNTLLIFFDLGIFIPLIPYFALAVLVALAVVVCGTGAKLWQLDMLAKNHQ